MSKVEERLEKIRKMLVYSDPYDNRIYANILGQEKLDCDTIERIAQEGLWYWYQEIPDSTFSIGAWVTRTERGVLAVCLCNACMRSVNREFLTFAPVSRCIWCDCKLCVCPARRLYGQYARYQCQECNACAKCFRERIKRKEE